MNLQYILYPSIIVQRGTGERASLAAASFLLLFVKVIWKAALLSLALSEERFERSVHAMTFARGSSTEPLCYSSHFSGLASSDCFCVRNMEKRSDGQRC